MRLATHTMLHKIKLTAVVILMIASLSTLALAQNVSPSPDPEPTKPTTPTPQTDTTAADPAVRQKAFANAATFAQNGDYARAYCIYAKYAAEGDAEAEYNIGWMYHNGYGLKIDDQAAARWWTKAGDQGYADALYALGQLYYHGGRGLKRNITKSVDYYIPAVEKGHDEAKLLLKILLAVNHPSTRQKRKAIIELLGNQPAEALRIKTAKANIRNAPSTQGRLLTRLKRGAIIAEIKTKGEWVQIGLPETGQVGWVFYTLVERAQTREVKRTILGETPDK